MNAFIKELELCSHYLFNDPRSTEFPNKVLLSSYLIISKRIIGQSKLNKKKNTWLNQFHDVKQMTELLSVSHYQTLFLKAPYQKMV